jgi:hypothetical protein
MKTVLAKEGFWGAMIARLRLPLLVPGIVKSAIVKRVTLCSAHVAHSPLSVDGFINKQSVFSHVLTTLLKWIGSSSPGVGQIASDGPCILMNQLGESRQVSFVEILSNPCPVFEPSADVGFTLVLFPLRLHVLHASLTQTKATQAALFNLPFLWIALVIVAGLAVLLTGILGLAIVLGVSYTLFVYVSSFVHSPSSKAISVMTEAVNKSVENVLPRAARLHIAFVGSEGVKPFLNSISPVTMLVDSTGSLEKAYIAPLFLLSRFLWIFQASFEAIKKLQSLCAFLPRVEGSSETLCSEADFCGYLFRPVG